MELNAGKGLALLCTLDLEDAWKTDPAAARLSPSDTRFRSDLDWTVFAESPETFAAGLLHVREIDRGSIVQTQFEPRWFETVNVPDGAKRLILQPGLYLVTGTLDIDDIKVFAE